MPGHLPPRLAAHPPRHNPFERRQGKQIGNATLVPLGERAGGFHTESTVMVWTMLEAPPPAVKLVASEARWDCKSFDPGYTYAG
jgi:hypothetical protein